MGKVLPQVTDGLRAFIERQHLFFVATAPLAGGHVNLSPKGMDSFRVLGPTTVAYLDNVGSGNETAAHLLDNGRITLMFCAFEGSPLILRLYGTGRAVLPTDGEWAELSARFPTRPGVRQIIVAELTRVQTSCGEAVPFLGYVGERDQLVQWAVAKGADGLQAYQRDKNVRSIDGLPTPLTGITPA
ncbi:MAG: pyridoxamine 5'-phosphate oxidase family protein [Vicinamibacteraceae bacterium]